MEGAEMTELPEPLTPPDCDLRGMEWMPLHGHKLYGSDFDAIASDAEYRAAQRLWWAAWQQQVPAASLPDDDRVLAHVAGYQRDPKGWAKVRDVALHAFIKCSDGRLYHRFLAPEAVIAWEKRIRERERKAAYRAKKDGQGGAISSSVPPIVPRDKTGTDASPDGDTNGDVRVDRTTQDRTGQDNLRKKEREEPLSPCGDIPPSQDAAEPERPSKPPRRSQVPEDWRPSERDRNFAICHMPEDAIDREAAQFVDHHRSRGTPFRDVSRAWQTWCRNFSKWNRPKPAPAARQSNLAWMLPPEPEDCAGPTIDQTGMTLQ